MFRWTGGQHILGAEDYMKDSVETRAMERATKHYEDKAWKVTNVSRVRKDHKGYDLLVQRRSEELKVEVKGSKSPYHGIPDLHSNELDDQGRLIADFLFVVYLPDDLPSRAAIIPRNEFPPNCMQRKVTYCIRSAWKNQAFIKRFLEEA